MRSKIRKKCLVPKGCQISISQGLRTAPIGFGAGIIQFFTNVLYDGLRMGLLFIGELSES